MSAPMARLAGLAVENARAAPLRLRRELQTPFARVHPQPVLILGNQKSGTSAVTGLLSRMTGEPASIELRRELNRPRYADVASGALPFEDFIRRNRLDFSRTIVKENHLTTMYDSLIRRFPESPVVLVVRDPRDNIRSLLNRLRLPGDRADLASPQREAVPAGWKLVLDGGWLGIDADNYIETLARRWNLTSDVYLQHPDRVVLVRYEDFMREKLTAIARLAGAVGLEPRHDITDSLEHQFQPRGDRGAVWETFFGARNLQLIENECSARMAAFTYPCSTATHGDVVAEHP